MASLHSISRGAVNTQATAISPSGDIVGRYFSANGQQHGFLLTQGKFQTIDPPDRLMLKSIGLTPAAKWSAPIGLWMTKAMAFC